MNKPDLRPWATSGHNGLSVLLIAPLNWWLHFLTTSSMFRLLLCRRGFVWTLNVCGVCVRIRARVCLGGLHACKLCVCMHAYVRGYMCLRFFVCVSVWVCLVRLSLARVRSCMVSRAMRVYVRRAGLDRKYVKNGFESLLKMLQQSQPDVRLLLVSTHGKRAIFIV